MSVEMNSERERYEYSPVRDVDYEGPVHTEGGDGVTADNTYAEDIPDGVDPPPHIYELETPSPQAREKLAAHKRRFDEGITLLRPPSNPEIADESDERVAPPPEARQEMGARDDVRRPPQSEAGPSEPADADPTEQPRTRDPRDMREPRHTEAPPPLRPEEMRKALHDAQDAVLREALRQGGEIPDDIIIDPADRAVVEGAVAIVRDNLERLTPGASNTRTTVVRAMASDRDLVQSATNGMTVSTILGMQRALDLTAENARARLAREAAQQLLPALDGKSATDVPTLESTATDFVTKVQPDEFNGQQGVQIAPYLAAYAVEVVGARFIDSPEVIAATVLGFEHSCDNARVTTKSIPESYQKLRVMTRKALEAAADQVNEEVTQLGNRGTSAQRMAEHAQASMRQHVVANCARVGVEYAQEKNMERHRAIEAANDTARREEEAKQAEIARREAIRAANIHDSHHYNRVVAATPETLVADIQQALSFQDNQGLMRRVAALSEHVEAGTPGADELMGVVRPHVERQLVDYAYAQRQTLMAGQVAPDLAKVIDSLNPDNMADKELARKVSAVLEVIDIRAAAYYHPKGRTVVSVRQRNGDGERLVNVYASATYSPQDIAVVRAGYIRNRMNVGVDRVVQEFFDVEQVNDAATVTGMYETRQLYLAEAAAGVDLARARLPERLRNEIAEARAFAEEYTRRVEAEGKTADGVAGWAIRGLRKFGTSIRENWK